jgi:DEAD/DEAH box helicase domain-containing protein
VEEDCTVAGPAIKAHGDVQVRSQVVGFKKIKFFTLENVGSGKLELPENEMHTTAYWITLVRKLIDSLSFSISERQDGLFGLLYAIESIASLLLMCDRMDLGTTIGEGDPSSPAYNGKSARLFDSSDIEFFEPTLFLFDAYPGGIGLSEPLYSLHEELIGRARQLIADCRCEKGCPSCVGPAGESSERAKEVALAILERMQGTTVVSH